MVGYQRPERARACTQVLLPPQVPDFGFSADPEFPQVEFEFVVLLLDGFRLGAPCGRLLLNLELVRFRFDAEGFEKVSLEVVWTLRKGGKDLAGRRFVATEKVAEPTWEALALAHGRLVDALAADIATALPASTRTP